MKWLALERVATDDEQRVNHFRSSTKVLLCFRVRVLRATCRQRSSFFDETLVSIKPIFINETG
jgi:hypothetical protein